MLGRNGTGLTYHLLVQWRCGVVPAFGCVARVTQRPPLAPHAAHHHFVSGEYLQEQGVLSRSKHSLELKSGTINPLLFPGEKRAYLGAALYATAGLSSASPVFLLSGCQRHRLLSFAASKHGERTSNGAVKLTSYE